MKSTQKIIILKDILIIFFFVACIPITFIYMFIRDFSQLNSLFSDYITSGTSIFLPFLSDRIIFFHFSTGHLIDIIIISNIIAFIKSGGYQYYVNVCLNRGYIDSYNIESEESVYEISLDPDFFFGLKQYSRYPLDDKILNLKSKQKESYYEKIYKSDEHLRKERFSNNLKQNRILLKTTYKNYFKKIQFFNFLSDYNKYVNTHVINHYLHPHISTFTDSNCLQKEG